MLSYRQLYEAVWGEDPMGNEANAVSCHVYGLRRKFREIALSLPSAIRCVREVGFCFEDIIGINRGNDLIAGRLPYLFEP